MSETVAIVSVVSSGVVGIGGIAAGYWGATSERRWKSNEERAVDARRVLEVGAEALTEMAWLIQEIRKKQLTKTVTADDLEKAEDILGRRALKVIALVGLRYGLDAPETQTFIAWTQALPQVLVALQEAGPNGAQYGQAMESVEAAEKAHFDVTSRLLS
jgi:hypothetical protein